MKNIKIIYFLFIFFLTACSSSKVISQQNQTPLSYHLEMNEPNTHYFDVIMTLQNIKRIPALAGKTKLLVKMPVWTPGSYLIREYAKNVINFKAESDGKVLNFKKINKNTWEIDIEKYNQLNISYKVYAFELSVRTSFLDDSHAYLNSASIFMYIPELRHQESELFIKPFDKWKTISTALIKNGKKAYQVPDYDTLVDSPIEIGNHEVLEFESMGIPHEIAMFSMEPLIYDKEKMLKDYVSFTQAATSIVGENPLDHYLFINHHIPNSGGGLEHLFSTTCQTSPSTYTSVEAYKGFFGTLAHEYFHLWNVKRIRPEALGPFDYENENYTNMLWVVEGFTSYYEEIILKRAGILNEEDVLKAWATAINTAENTPGNKVQSVTEASWDAWIKYYRPNENSINTSVSYYGKGGLLAGLLNLEILNGTKGEKSLDDVFRLLWNKYYKELQRGYTDDEFQNACEVIAGKNLDSFFKDYVSGTLTPDYKKLYDYAGIKVTNSLPADTESFLGLTASGNTVTRVYSNGSAYPAGINVGDELLKVDGKEINALTDLSKGKKVGDVITVQLKRSNVLLEYKMTLLRDTRNRYKLEKSAEMTPSQQKIYDFLMANK